MLVLRLIRSLTYTLYIPSVTSRLLPIQHVTSTQTVVSVRMATSTPPTTNLDSEQPRTDEQAPEGSTVTKEPTNSTSTKDATTDTPSREEKSTTPPVEDTGAYDSKSGPQPTPTQTGDSSKNVEKKDSETKDKSTSQTKPWYLCRSSTSPTETREYIENLPIAEKRKLYKCGKSYLQLEDIQRWPDFKIANNCKSKHSLKRPVAIDDSLSDRISIWRGDITKLEIDAIVNAANKSLLGGGGVDGAIHDAAGRSLHRECYELDGCDTGGTKLTCGYRLPAKYILHTVGPMGERKDALQSCYESCLRLVEKNSIKSIAFCCISTGIYGYPNMNAALVAVRTVRSWFETSNYAKTQMERVIFCVFLKVDYEIYSDLLCLFFPTSPPITAASGQDKAKESTSKEAVTAASEGTDGREARESTPPVTEESATPQPLAPSGVPPLTQSATAPAALTSGDNPPQDKSREEVDDSTRDESEPLTGEATGETSETEPKSKLPKLEGSTMDESEPLTGEATGETSETEPKYKLPKLEGSTRDESEPLTGETSGLEPKSKLPKLEGEESTSVTTGPTGATTCEKMEDKSTEDTSTEKRGEDNTD